jgi:uncharacterized protein DUF6600
VRANLAKWIVLGALAAGCAGGTVATAGPSYAPAYTEAQPSDTDVFRAQLEPYGRWQRSPEYGMVFVPNDRDFVPFTHGRWVYTDQGYTWAGDEPYSWATAHYGNWVNDPSLGGWAWIPGDTWQPATVEWYEGPDVIGWAPRGPRGQSYDRFARFVPYTDLNEPGGHYVRSEDYQGRTRRIDRLDADVLQRHAVALPPQPVPIRRVDLSAQQSIDERRQAIDAQRRLNDQLRRDAEAQRVTAADAAARAREAQQREAEARQRAQADDDAAAQRARREAQGDRREDQELRRQEQMERRGGPGANPAADQRDIQRNQRDQERNMRDQQRALQDQQRAERKQLSAEGEEQKLMQRLDALYAEERKHLTDSLDARDARERAALGPSAARKDRDRLAAKQAQRRQQEIDRLDQKQRMQTQEEVRRLRASNPSRAR